MSKRKGLLLMLAVALLFAAQVEAQSLIEGVTAKASSAIVDRHPDNLLNSDGMDENEIYFYNLDGSVAGEPTSANDVEWVTVSGGFPAAILVDKVWAVFDLGKSQSVNRIDLWNFQWDHSTVGDLSNRGLSQFDVYIRDAEADTDDGTVGGAEINVNVTDNSFNMDNAIPFDLGAGNQWQLVLENQTLAQAPNNDVHTATSYELANQMARFVAIKADDWHGGNGGGLGKVRIYTLSTASQNPTPADGSAEVALETALSWDPGADPANPTQPNPVITGYKVYIDDPEGSDPNQALLATTTAGVSSVLPADYGLTLKRDLTYSWRVDATTAGDDITGVDWTFQTLPSDPIIDAQPVDALAFPTEDATFTVAASDPFNGNGDGLSYQWQEIVDGVGDDLNEFDPKYEGAKAATLTIKDVQVADEGYYRCIVTINSNGNSLATSNAALGVKRTLAYWPFDGDLDDDTAAGWDGDYVNIDDPNASPAFVEGKAGDAVAFGGSECIFVGDGQNPLHPPQMTGQTTLSMWVQWNSIVGYQGLVAKRDDEHISAAWYLRTQNNDVLEFESFNDLSGPTTTVTTEEWYYIAVTFDGETAVMYVNGVAASSASMLLSDNPGSQFVIGCAKAGDAGADPPTPSLFLDGKIDDLRVYNYALDATAVGLEYVAVNGPFCVESVRSMFDVSGDCIVGIEDFAAFAAEWLDCAIFPNCISEMP